ncbi:unnamed protein product [Paramecium sonneborni]|uniref:Uncharacterized protein n=1 Tax=Paramecium sonneborni TaxID=65129 RepID=A0A8S1MR50_9CILI|nr:unnamed protein product [Paramecium sonneborni]
MKNLKTYSQSSNTIVQIRKTLKNMVQSQLGMLLLLILMMVVINNILVIPLISFNKLQIQKMKTFQT